MFHAHANVNVRFNAYVHARPSESFSRVTTDLFNQQNEQKSQKHDDFSADHRGQKWLRLTGFLAAARAVHASQHHFLMSDMRQEAQKAGRQENATGQAVSHWEEGVVSATVALFGREWIDPIYQPGLIPRAAQQVAVGGQCAEHESHED